jgi:restriction system protein
MNHETEDDDDRFSGAKGVYLGSRAPSLSGEDDPDRILVGNRGWRLDLSTYQLIHDGEGLATVDAADPTVLLKSVLLEFQGSSDEGMVVKRPRATWFEISKHLRIDPEFRFAFSTEPTAFEEFLAGAYQIAGWDAVMLTPQSGDKGRDVIAVTTGLATIRVLDQAKAYGKNHPVRPDDVRALYGVLMLDQRASKGIVTTTSDFAPSIASEFGQAIPYRLELRNGSDFVEWVKGQHWDDS